MYAFDLGLSSRTVFALTGRFATLGFRETVQLGAGQSMEQMTAGDYDRLVKLMAMLGSPSDGEVLNAVGAASRILNSYGLSWSDLVLPRKLLPVRGSANEDLPVDPEQDLSTGPPPPLSEATPDIMFAHVMSSANVSPETKRDIRRHADAIKEGRVTPAIRGELQTMYNYAVLQGRRV